MRNEKNNLETEPKLPPLELEWRKYHDACYPPNKVKITPIQEVECRQAFFAGCFVALGEVVKAAADMPEDVAYKYTGDLIQEAQMVCYQRVFEMK